MTERDTRLKPEGCALVLLAAGRSERFGVSDKLAEPFLGKPLALHAVTAFAAVPFAHRFAITAADCAIDFKTVGFQVIVNSSTQDGLSGSLRLGVRAAREAGARSVLVALADMPRVTAAQVHRLFDASDGAGTVVASSDGRSPKPPALFGADHFLLLEQLKGDGGARGLILAGRHVVTTPAELVDVDTENDVAALRDLYGTAHHRSL